jgi:DNA-binding response OmpR family regulator
MRTPRAEDQATSASFLRRTLEWSGREVIVAAEGNAARRLAHDESDSPAITDWMTPRIDGLELCRRIGAQPVDATHTSSA